MRKFLHTHRGHQDTVPASCSLSLETWRLIINLSRDVYMYVQYSYRSVQFYYSVQRTFLCSMPRTLSIKLTPDYILWNLFRKRSFKWEVKLIWVCYSRSGVGETGRSNSMFQLEQNPCTVWLNLLTGDSTPSGSVLYWNFFNLKWHPFARKD